MTLWGLTMLNSHSSTSGISAVGRFRRRARRLLLSSLLLALVSGHVLAAWHMVTAGSGHTLALDGDGTVWGWGYNKYGSVGDGSTVETSPYAQTAARRAALTDVVSIASGQGFNIAVRSDGSVWTWGYGYLGHGAYEGRTTPTQVAGLLNIRQAASGLYHTLALGYDGAIKAWGNNSRGAVGDGSNTHRSTPVAVALADVSAVAASGHSLALKSDGTVWAWGENDLGQAGGVAGQNAATPRQVAGLAGVQAVAAGRYHSLALKADGTVWAWGEGIALGDGSGSDSATPVQAALADVVAIAAGSGFSLALKADGTVWVFGIHTYAADGSYQATLSPRQIDGLAAVSRIGAGFFHGIAILADGGMRSWGMNDVGQLGNGQSASASASAVGVLADGGGNLTLQPESAPRSAADRLFNWAESAYADMFYPHSLSGQAAGYYYRCYATGACLGEQDGRAYLYNGVITDVGAIDALLGTLAVPAGY